MSKIQKFFNAKNKAINYTYKILFTITIVLVYLCLPVMFTSFFGKILGISSTIIVSSVASLLTLLIILLIFNRTLIDNFYDFKKNWKKYMMITIKYWAIGVAIMMVSNFIINYFIMGGNTISGNEEKVREYIVKYPLYAMISACIFAPISEELTFRLGFRKLFKRAIPFALVTAFVFAGLHVMTDFNDIKQLCYLVPYGALGFAFAYAYFKTNNIFSTICMHFIHNTVTYTLILISYWSML